MNPLARKNRRQDTRTAARYSGLSSNQIVRPVGGRSLALPPPKIVAREEILVPAIPVQAYETFMMR